MIVSAVAEEQRAGSKEVLAKEVETFVKDQDKIGSAITR